MSVGVRFARRGVRLQHELALPWPALTGKAGRVPDDAAGLDLYTAALKLAASVCDENGCVGVLGPWGHARTRWLRLGPDRTEAHTPHVLLPARTYPRRPDTVETVGAALLAAVDGPGNDGAKLAPAGQSQQRHDPSQRQPSPATLGTPWLPGSTRPAAPSVTWSTPSAGPSPLTYADSDRNTRPGNLRWQSPVPGSSLPVPARSSGTRPRDQRPASTRQATSRRHAP